MNYQIINIKDKKEILADAARWFSSKWEIPYEAYYESMCAGLDTDGGVPTWYVCLCDGEIVGGIGVIENDFHNRPDLTPNACALYVEKEYRGNSIAGKPLEAVVSGLADVGIDTVYLLTEHVDFYERYGWSFLCPVQGDGEEQMSRMYVRKTK